MSLPVLLDTLLLAPDGLELADTLPRLQTDLPPSAEEVDLLLLLTRLP